MAGIERLGFYDAEQVKEFLTPGGMADLSGSFQTTSPTLQGLDAIPGTLGVIEQTAPDTFAIRLIGTGNATDLLTRSGGDGRYILATALDTDGTLAANSDAKVATQKATKTYVDAAVTGVMKFKGVTDCSANPNYPAASKGDAYIVTVAGKIGGASGKSVDVGDVYLASANNAGGTEAAVGTSWNVLEHNLVGALLSANNLSDLTSATTARGNLGLGTAAVQNTGTSGNTVALLDGTNTWANQQTFSANPSLAGGGISFPATQVPSAGANTLDDYEEGTFTPVLTFGAATTGITYSTQTGIYTKIGRLVECEIRLVLTSKGSATGTAIITGLPFTGTGGTLPRFIIQLNNVVGFNVPAGGISGTLDGVGLSNFNGTTVAAVTDTSFANNSVISVTGTYVTT